MRMLGLGKVSGLLALFLAGWWPNSVMGNGAFPDSMGILLPSDRPNVIIAATNFGLLISEDDGASWGWVCEEAVAVNPIPGNIVSLYEVSRPPNDLVLAVSFSGVSYSIDFGCSWDLAGGGIGDYFMYDISPDAVDPLRSYALARHGNMRSAHESRDGARTYGPALLTSTAPEYLTGIENARSGPAALYVTVDRQVTAPALWHPFIGRSYDNGSTWQPLFDPGPDFDHFRIPGLIAIDPEDEKRVYLRLADASHVGQEALAIYDDLPQQGTGTMRRVLEYQRIGGPISAFLRRSDGALIVGALNGRAFISTDQGNSFESWPNAPHLRGLGERNGVLFAVADNFVDGYAVGRSNDGETWEGLIRFQELTGPKNCGNLPTICAAAWERLRSTLGIPASDGGMDGGVDGGADGGIDAGTDAGVDAGNRGDRDGGTDAGVDDNAPSKHSGCTVSGSGAVPWSVLALLFGAIALRLAHRQSKR